MKTEELRRADDQDGGRVNYLYWTGWSLFRVFFTLYFRWRVHHPERVPNTGGVILACNHASYLDPPLVGAAVDREINYLARKTLFSNPVFGKVLRAVNSVPVDRDGGSASGVRTIMERLKAGGGIILFPEGTRTSDGQLQPARSGIGMTVMKSAVPVVPVRVFGSFEAYGRKNRFPKPHKVVVKFGEPMWFQELRSEANNCSKERLREIYQEIADELMKAIARLQPCEDKKTFP